MLRNLLNGDFLSRIHSQWVRVYSFPQSTGWKCKENEVEETTVEQEYDAKVEDITEKRKYDVK